MSLIHNERTKLFANALDRASTACLTVGVLAPGAAVFYAMTSVGVPLKVLVSGTFYWLGLAIALHLLARRVLGGLRT